MEEKLRNMSTGSAMIIGIILALVYYMALVHNSDALLHQQVAQTQQQISQDRTKIIDINKSIQAAKNYKTVKSTLGAEMQKVIKAIPTQLTSLEFMQTISSTANSTGLQINSVSPSGSFRQSDNVSGSKKNKKVFFEPVVVNVELTGTYNQVMQFMSALTALDKIVTVDNLSMKSTLSHDSVPIIHFKSDLSAYRFVSENSSSPPKGSKK